MPKRTTKRRVSRSRGKKTTGRSVLQTYHIPLVICAAIVTTLIVVLTGGGTGQFAGSLVDPPDAVLYAITGPDSGPKGSELTYTITTKNEGASFFTGLIVTLSPLDLTYVNASVACEKQKNGDVVCSRKSIGAVDPGKQDEFTVTVAVSTACPGDAYLAASAKIAQRENNTTNNTKVKEVKCT